MPVEMESIQVFNPLLELLSLSKEHDNNSTFRSPNVFLHPSSSKGSSNGTNEEQLELLVNQLHGDDDLGLQLRALQALEDLVAAPNDVEIKAKVVHYTGALTGLLVLLADNNNPAFQVRSVKIIRHLADGNFETKATIVNHPGALDGLVDSFSRDTNPSLQQNAAGALSLLAASNDNIKSKIAQEFVLKGLVTLLDDGTDPILHSSAISTWRNLEASGSQTVSRIMVSEVFDHDVQKLRRLCLLKEIPTEGDSFEGLGTYLLDLANEEEFRIRSEESHGNSSRGKEDGNHRDQGRQIGGTDDGKQREKGKQRDDDKQTGGLEKGKKRYDGKQIGSLEDGKQWEDGKQAGGEEDGKQRDDGKQTGGLEKGKKRDDGKQKGGLEKFNQRDDSKEIGGLKDGKQWDDGKQAGGEEDGKQKDDCLGCCSFYSLFLGPTLAGLWPAWIFRKENGVAFPESGSNDGDGDADVSPGERPLEALLVSLSNDLEGKDLRQQRKTLQGLCDRTQSPLNGNTASYVAQHPEGLMELVSLFSSPSLRGPAGLVLKNLAGNHQEIMVTIVGLLISLTTYANPLQESAVWGLGSLAAGNDCIKAETVTLEHGALNSLVAMLPADTTHPEGHIYLEQYVKYLKATRIDPRASVNYSLQTMAARTLKILATGDCKIKATIGQFPQAIDRLVSSLTTGVDDLPVDCDDLRAVDFATGEVLDERRPTNGFREILCKSGVRNVDETMTVIVTPPDVEFARSVIAPPLLPENAALALGYLAAGDGKTKARVIDHQGTLVGLGLALTRGDNPVLQQNAAFALGNLAGGDGQTKAKIIDHPGLLKGLVFALRKDEWPTLQQNAAFALSNLAGGNNQVKAKIVDRPELVEALLVSLTKKTNPALQKNAAKALDLLATGDSETKSKIVNHPGILEGLMFSSQNFDNIGMRWHLKWASRSLAANDDVGTMARTKICDGLLWKLYSTPVFFTGSLTANSTSPLPPRSDIYETFRKHSDERRSKRWENYIKFGYICQEDRDSQILTTYFIWPPGPPTRRTASLRDQPHLETLLEALPKDIDAFENSSSLQRQAIRNLCIQRQAIRNLCIAVASPESYHDPLICGKIVDYPGLIDGLGIVLREDSNPHLQLMAVSTLTVLVTKGNSATARQIFNNPALLAGLVTCLTKDENPLLQENTLETLESLRVHYGGKTCNHSGVLTALVMILTKDGHPNWQLKAYRILSSLARKTEYKILDHLTLLLEPGNTISFQYLASSIVLHLAWTGDVVAVTKIVDLHPWVLEILVASLQSSCEFYFFESTKTRNDPRDIPALVLHNLLARGDDETKAKLSNYRGVTAALVTALAEDRYPETQEKAACALSHLAEGDDERKAKLVEHPGALAGLIMQLPENNRVLRRTSALTLASLAQGTVQTKAKIVDHPGVLAGLVMSLSKDESPRLQMHAAQALLLLAEGDVETTTKIVYHPGALEWLVKSLGDDENPRLQSNSVFALRNLALAEEHRKRLRETDGLVEGLQDLLGKEGPSLVKRQTRLIVKQETPSPLKWLAAACTLTLLDPVRGNGTHLHTKDAYCGRGRANLLLGLYNEALNDLNMADMLQQLRKPDEDLNLDVSRAIWRDRSAVKTRLGDFQGAREDTAKLQQSS